MGRRRSSKHTPSFIIHHSGIILLTQQAFRFSHKLEFGIIPLWFHQAQHSPSAPRKPRANSPLIQVQFQSLLINTFCISLTIILQLADHALSELSGQLNIAIPSSSSQPFIPAGSNLDEIHLKQVSTFSFGRFHHTSCFHLPSQFYLLFRHKNPQTIVCSLFKLEPPPRKKEKKQHRPIQWYYRTKSRPNSRNPPIFWIKTSAN